MLKKQPTTDQELLATLRLIRTEGIGPITFYKLIAKFGSAEQVILNWETINQFSKKKFVLADPKEIHTEIQQTMKAKAQFLLFCDPRYPKLLREIPDAPPVLIARGNIELFNQKAIAIVGARNASIHGKRLAYLFARDLGSAGWIVASGFARGVDQSAHEGSLKTGTIAVLAGGIDQIYPTENERLYYEIIEHGVVISECAWGQAPTPKHFPKRNRLISGLSAATIVIEAAYQSGSLLTAKYAADQGRDVMAVPGSPLDPRSRGSNALLKQGAPLVENAQDVLDLLGYAEISMPQIEPAASCEEDYSEIESKILEALGPYPIPIDTLIDSLEISPRILWSTLAQLELSGKIVRSSNQEIFLSCT